MKKTIALLLSVLLLCLSAAGIAEAPSIDLSALSFDQLVALREQLNLAIWNSQEWQEVTVPAGVYQIGVDIPAGHWSIRTASAPDFLTVFYFEKLDDDGITPSVYGGFYTVDIGSPGYNLLPYTLPDIIDYDMQAGWYFKTTKSVVFSPYIGKPDLGFK